MDWLSSTSYVSAGDEKIARVFIATCAFFIACEQFSGVQFSIRGKALAEGECTLNH